jgi:ribosomal protein S16
MRLIVAADARAVKVWTVGNTRLTAAGDVRRPFKRLQALDSRHDQVGPAAGVVGSKEPALLVHPSVP